MRGRLGEIEPRDAEQAAERLAARVLDLQEVKSASGVFLCLSFGAEIDTWRLVDRLCKQGKCAYVPRVVLDDHSFHVHPFPCRLATLGMGLRQPLAGEPELTEDEIDDRIDVALLLGLAFDRSGVRLGYGAGFFDRFLHHHPLHAVGLAHDEQIVEQLPREDHDVPMRRLVTPSGLIDPGPRSPHGC